MRTLTAVEHVACPPVALATVVERYLHGLAPAGSELRLHLKIPGAAFGLPGGPSLEKTVVAHLTHMTAASGIEPKLYISWEPEGGGPFPTFHGGFTTQAGDGGLGSTLVLSGTYAPPAGMAGKAFDAAIGYWVARATIRELLTHLRDGAEHEYVVAREAET